MRQVQVLNTAADALVPSRPDFLKCESQTADVSVLTHARRGKTNQLFLTSDITWPASSVLALCWISEEY